MKVRWTTQAEQDRADILAYIAADNVRAAVARWTSCSVRPQRAWPTSRGSASPGTEQSKGELVAVNVSRCRWIASRRPSSASSLASNVKPRRPSVATNQSRKRGIRVSGGTHGGADARTLVASGDPGATGEFAGKPPAAVRALERAPLLGHQL